LRLYQRIEHSAILLLLNKYRIYIPQLDEEKCNECGLCFEVCPGHAVYFVASLFSKSFDREDIMMLTVIENRVGVNITPIKKILKRFL